MDLQFVIDEERCIQCGACADDCPYHIIHLDAGFPALKANRVHHCIRCQHCLAVCPTGALSIFGRSPDDSLALPQHLPSAAQMEALIRGRRSIRHFRSEPVATELIDRLLAAMANSPSGKNDRPWLFTVVESPEAMAELRRAAMEGLVRVVTEKRLSREHAYYRHVVKAWNQGRDIIFRNAPHLLLVSVPNTITTPDADTLIAMSYFELLAATMGVGTLWNAMIRQVFALIDDDLYRRLGIPDDHVKGYVLLFGYPAVRYFRTVQRDQAQVNRVHRLLD